MAVLEAEQDRLEVLSSVSSVLADQQEVWLEGTEVIRQNVLLKAPDTAYLRVLVPFLVVTIPTLIPSSVVAVMARSLN